ncbi:hypothetical protein NQ036_03585 [Brevibacterium sp. 91QC2O2]|uniref:hypothetical protein n=1 Tax=Brevibacterium TaxID=1696 RepID=UPI00211BADE5|nr:MULTISPECIES: hypothetical protein [unclassified Brevibacterium]MCQ9367328.1 hypothetical protein [Brevibacterium sp. 91QC2O2]MCQ9384659.1 hypothetical protein [Brevibacterium sp. 68QC2CO]
MKLVITPNAQASQTEHPGKATLRTFIQTLIPTLALALIAAPPVVQAIIDEFARHDVTLPAWVYAALSGVAVAASLISALVARIMAIPQVEALLRTIGLGAAPNQVPADDHADYVHIDPDQLTADDGAEAVDYDDFELVDEAGAEDPDPVEIGDDSDGDGDEAEVVDDTDTTPAPADYEPRH